VIIFAFLVKTPLYDKILSGEFSGGLYNGYVGFSGTPLPGSYQSGGNGKLDSLIDVHGGITFDSVCDMSKLWRGEIIPITECPSEGIYRVVGFDTLHCDDDMFMWNFERTKNEILKIQKI
jgi:hypothetical protein